MRIVGIAGNTWPRRRGASRGARRVIGASPGAFGTVLSQAIRGRLRKYMQGFAGFVGS
jgi:hypothetical protein